MKAYKGFDKDLCCRDFQYEIGKTYECDEAVMCKKGFHACLNPINVYNYYSPKSRFCEVDIEDFIEGDDKLCGKRITIVREFTPKEYVEECIKYVQTSGLKAHAQTSGYKAHAQTSGCAAHAQTSGDYAHAQTSESYSHTQTSGYKAHAQASGTEAYVSTFGNGSHVQTSGPFCDCVTYGDNSSIHIAGIGSTFTLKGNSKFCAVNYYDNKYNLLGIVVGEVGKNIEKDVTYYVNNKGEFISVN